MQNLFIGIDFSKKKFDVTVMYRGKRRPIPHFFKTTRKATGMMIDWVKSKQVMNPGELAVLRWEHGPLQFSAERVSVRPRLFHVAGTRLHDQSWTAAFSAARAIKVTLRTLRNTQCAMQTRPAGITAKSRRYWAWNCFSAAVNCLSRWRGRCLFTRQNCVQYSKEHLCGLWLQTLHVWHKPFQQGDKGCWGKEKRKSGRIRRSGELRTDNLDKGHLAGQCNSFHHPHQQLPQVRHVALSGLLLRCGPVRQRLRSSVHVKPHVSRFANKTLKSLLTQAARCAVIHDSRLRGYYLRMLEKGKADKLVINNVRNKLVHCMMAVVRTRMAYDPDYLDHKVVSNNC